MPLQLLHWIIWGSKQINLREKRSEAKAFFLPLQHNLTAQVRERESDNWRPCFPTLLPSPKSSVIELVLSPCGEERAGRETRGNSLTCLPETEPHRYAKPEGSTPLLSFYPRSYPFFLPPFSSAIRKATLVIPQHRRVCPASQLYEGSGEGVACSAGFHS